MKSVHKLLVLIGVMIVGLSLSSTADQLDTWRGRNPLPQGNNLDGIGNGDAPWQGVSTFVRAFGRKRGNGLHEKKKLDKFYWFWSNDATVFRIVLP